MFLQASGHGCLLLRGMAPTAVAGDQVDGLYDLSEVADVSRRGRSSPPSVLLGRLGLSRLGGDWSFGAVVAAAAVRTAILDAAVRSFAEASRHPTLVTIGAGLCTRCVRLRDLDADWIDIDLPGVAALRSALLPPTPNRIVLGESALDSRSRDQVAAIDGPRLFVLEGLTMYLEEDAVRDLVTGLADRCPGSHLLVDTTGPRTGLLGATGSSATSAALRASSAGACGTCQSWPRGITACTS